MRRDELAQAGYTDVRYVPGGFSALIDEGGLPYESEKYGKLLEFVGDGTRKTLMYSNLLPDPSLAPSIGPTSPLSHPRFVPINVTTTRSHLSRARSTVATREHARKIRPHGGAQRARGGFDSHRMSVVHRMLRESGEKSRCELFGAAAFARSQTDGESSQLDDWCASAMTLMVQDCGVSERDAGAIIDEALKAVKRSHRVETKTHGDARDVIRNTHGGIFNPTFLDSIEPLYDLHMGAENMGPLLLHAGSVLQAQEYPGDRCRLHEYFSSSSARRQRGRGS